MSTAVMVDALKSISFSESCSELIKLHKTKHLPENEYYFSLEISTKQGGVYEILTHSYDSLRVMFKSIKTLIDQKH